MASADGERRERPGKAAMMRAAVEVMGEDGYEGASIRDMAVMMPLMVLVMLIGMAFVMRSKLATLALPRSSPPSPSSRSRSRPRRKIGKTRFPPKPNGK